MMKSYSGTDTIAAIATPLGLGAIAVVRMSGEGAFTIADSLIDGSVDLSTLKPQHLARAQIMGPEQQPLDDILIVKFKSPRSYTGEDMIELHCHGGLYLVQEVLKSCLNHGARLADPGEFTRRAFIHGKLDLLQAESIDDRIRARSQKSLDLSVQQASGALSSRLTDIRQRLIQQCGLLELELDFSEEDVDFADRETLLSDLNTLRAEIDLLIDAFEYGRLIREGMHTVLIGRPNVGKSLLLNHLLQQDRAIVSDIPGTTRDSLEESLDLDGYLFRLHDTAGLRQTLDYIESKGVDRTRRLMDQADLWLAMLDQHQPLHDDDRRMLDSLSGSSARSIVILNKNDLAPALDPDDIAQRVSPLPVVTVSAKTGFGIDMLKQAMINAIVSLEPQRSGIITKMRHYQALSTAREHLQHAEASLRDHLSAEFIALDLRAALDAVGEVTGDVSSDDILNMIFSSFCIGK
jgi:tRNA modification GTPase